MTFTVALAVALTPISISASAPAAGQYQASIIAADGTVVQSQNADTASFIFKGVAAAAYTAAVSRLDINGAVIEGSVATAEFTLTDPAAPVDPTSPTDPMPPMTVSIDVPSTVTVTATLE